MYYVLYSYACELYISIVSFESKPKLEYVSVGRLRLQDPQKPNLSFHAHPKTNLLFSVVSYTSIKCFFFTSNTVL